MPEPDLDILEMRMSRKGTETESQHPQVEFRQSNTVKFEILRSSSELKRLSHELLSKNLFSNNSAVI